MNTAIRLTLRRVGMVLLAAAPLLSLPCVSCSSAPKAQFTWDDSNTRPYSSSVSVGQDLVLLAGKIGSDRSSFDREVVTALDGVEAGLREQGLGLHSLVSVTVYLTDMGRYDEFNAIYGARLSHPYPVRTCVAVAALPLGAQVEIQAIAVRK